MVCCSLACMFKSIGICLLLLTIQANSPAEVDLKDCPQPCSCNQVSEEWGPAVNVQCGERNLKSLPSTTFDKVVSILNISFNDLTTLEEETFSQYKSVHWISLHYCNLYHISENAFQHLENLTFVDLSHNRFTSVPPNLFSANKQLNKLTLRRNDLSTLPLNTSILNGPPSLSVLHLQSCQISNLSSVTFSSLPNLKEIDISNNHLLILNFDTLSAHQHLKDVNLDKNWFQCGSNFKELLCGMQTSLSLSHIRTVRCWHENGKKEIWTPEFQLSVCRPIATPSVTPSFQSDTNASTTLIPSVTPSNKSGVSRNMRDNPTPPPDNKSGGSTNMTDNPTTPLENKNGIIHPSKIVGIVIVSVVILGVAVFVMYNFKIRHRGCATPPVDEGELTLLHEPEHSQN